MPLFLAPAAFVQPPSSPFTGDLDAYESNGEVFAATWRLLGSYTGSLIRVKRSSDSTEQDIGYDADGELDVAALLAFVGTDPEDDGYVTRVYNQIDNGATWFASVADDLTIVEKGMVLRNGGIRAVIRHSDTAANIEYVYGTTQSFTAFSWATMGRQVTATNARWFSTTVGTSLDSSGGDTWLVYRRSNTTGSWYLDTNQATRTISSIASSAAVKNAHAGGVIENGADVDWSLFDSESGNAITTGTMTTHALRDVDKLGWNNGFTTGGAAGVSFTTNSERAAFASWDIKQSDANIEIISDILFDNWPKAPSLTNVDAHTTDLEIAAGFWKLISTTTANAIRVKRSSDSTEQDIGFSGNEIDETALSAFVGTGGTDTGYVTRIYNQADNGATWFSDNGNDNIEVVTAGVINKDRGRVIGVQATGNCTLTYTYSPIKTGITDYAVVLVGSHAAANTDRLFASVETSAASDTGPDSWLVYCSGANALAFIDNQNQTSRIAVNSQLVQAFRAHAFAFKEDATAGVSSYVWDSLDPFAPTVSYKTTGSRLSDAAALGWYTGFNSGPANGCLVNTEYGCFLGWDADKKSDIQTIAEGLAEGWPP